MPIAELKIAHKVGYFTKVILTAVKITLVKAEPHNKPTRDVYTKNVPFLSKAPVLHWTHHSRAKMRQYGFSEARVKRIIHSPMRIEEGIAPKTIAMMQRAGSKRHPYEVWVMIQETPKKRKVISAWRYPGVTKPGDPLPPEILKEIRGLV